MCSASCTGTRHADDVMGETVISRLPQVLPAAHGVSTQLSPSSSDRVKELVPARMENSAIGKAAEVGRHHRTSPLSTIFYVEGRGLKLPPERSGKLSQEISKTSRIIFGGRPDHDEPLRSTEAPRRPLITYSHSAQSPISVVLRILSRVE
jgi:hypothetical protein